MTTLIECEACEGLGTTDTDHFIGPQTCVVCEGAGRTTPIRLESWAEFDMLVNPDAFWDHGDLYGPAGWIGRIEPDEPVGNPDWKVFLCIGNITDEAFLGYFTHDEAKRTLLIELGRDL